MMLLEQESLWLWTIYCASASMISMVIWRLTRAATLWFRATVSICLLLLLLAPKHIEHSNGAYFAPMVISHLFHHFFE